MGDFSVNIKKNYNDEIGQLAEKFDNMAGRLSAIIKDLTRGLKRDGRLVTLIYHLM